MANNYNEIWSVDHPLHFFLFQITDNAKENRIDVLSANRLALIRGSGVMGWRRFGLKRLFEGYTDIKHCCKNKNKLKKVKGKFAFLILYERNGKIIRENYS